MRILFGLKKVIKFCSSDIGINVSFCDNVVDEMKKHQQHSQCKEAGGILFSRLNEDNHMVISKITTPSFWDKRFLDRFVLNKRKTQKEINSSFKNGFHYVGDWHTHSEVNPRPSGIDLSTIKSVYNKSKHELRYFLIVILSSSSDFKYSYVAFVDGRNVFRCEMLPPNLYQENCDESSLNLIGT